MLRTLEREGQPLAIESRHTSSLPVQINSCSELIGCQPKSWLALICIRAEAPSATGVKNPARHTEANAIERWQLIVGMFNRALYGLIAKISGKARFAK